MQHVGVTSASEVHKYPADIGKYVVSFITDALGACHCVFMPYFSPPRKTVFVNLIKQGFSMTIVKHC